MSLGTYKLRVEQSKQGRMHQGGLVEVGGTTNWMERDNTLDLGCCCSNDEEDEASAQDWYWSATARSMPQHLQFSRQPPAPLSLSLSLSSPQGIDLLIVQCY
jgi:hypothetical protein